MGNDTSRRNFLVGAAAAGVGLSSLKIIGCGPEDTIQCPEPMVWPLTYQKLDVEQTRKLGHLGYYNGHCCYGVFSAIIGQLADIVGSPFTEVPLDMMRWGAGGVAGFGSLCGSLTGACTAIGIVTDEATAKSVITDLLTWYAETPMPTDISNTYAQNHEFLVDTLKTDAVLAQSVAGMNLCHASVTNWCIASGYASGSTERAERCARVTGDTAAKTAELLNAVADGTYVASGVIPADAAMLDSGTTCRTCHSKSGTGLYGAGGNYTRGKMHCTTCHTDLLQVDTATHK